MGGGGDKMKNGRTTTSMSASLPEEEADTGAAASTSSSKDGTTNKKKKKEAKPQASMTETLAFAFQCGTKVKALFFLGSFAGVLNGLVYPALAYLFSSSFSDIAGAQSQGLAQVRELAYTFLIVGVYALVCGLVQSWCFEIVAYHSTQNFRLQWFGALLRQDAAYFDVHDVGGIAGQVGPSSNKFRRGLGRKFGEGIQFLTTGIGGVAFGFYSSWQVAFVVLAMIPFVSIAALMVLKLNQSKSTRQAAVYKTAGGVAYSAVSSIKTVLSLNAVQTMVNKYSEATQEAYNQATSIFVKQGFWNGSMLGSFLLLYCILTLFGSFLLYRDVEDTGCDPSDSNPNNETCNSSGPDVFGAMLGIAFAAQGVSQFGNFSEAFTAARVAAHDALEAINRKPGAPEETIYRTPEDDADIGTTTHSKKSNENSAATPEKSELVDGGQVIRAILPKYEIDSTSDKGLKPENIQGRLTFKDVKFTYPTRPQEQILNGLSTEIEPGQTVAFVGPSGSGKSTVVAMLERFYDCQSGSIELDGVNVKDINVAYLRGCIGYVGQEPTLFATSIRENIRHGNPDATDEEIKEAAKMSNAHDFITSFSDGYDTQVGDKGSQLSGGQKQRIAIARILVGKPKILLLDEATSALDAESELVVQEALDNIMQQKKITTVIIAHRLSTIRSCDIINVLVYGNLLERGTHDELMAKDGYYRKLVEKQDGTHDNSGSNSALSSRNTSTADLQGLESEAAKATTSSLDEVPHLSFNNVRFAYPTRPKKIIFDNFSLDIAQGSTVALVGPSGGGKSTTVGLLERFYDPIEGAIYYQGYDVRALNVHWYRDQIGYVGQEPTLFNDTIANNIAYGAPGATRKEIEEAAKQANAHDFITMFDEGYDTVVGERGGRLSGGQKQRVAIARALVKKPKVLILDEATSALDNESEALVQAAIDKLMESQAHTCVVIAHRLSTIRNATTIALIGDGGVVEQGSHDELIAKPHGRYKRLFDSSKRDTAVTTANLKMGQIVKADKDEQEEEEEIDWEAIIAEEEAKAFNGKRAREMASPDALYLLIGCIGALLAGSVFPLWGVLFSETINLLFQQVAVCPDVLTGVIPEDFPTCEAYWDDVADDMRKTSFRVAVYWVILGVFGCLLGHILIFKGFGEASERLNKRVRDSSFKALLRQEVSFFDKRSVGAITSQLQDDTGRIQAFSGEPVRAIIMAISSIVIGVTLSFFFMWQFALLAIGCIPIMGFATSMEMKKMLGEDLGDDEDGADGQNSAGGVIVETLLNIRTVSALTLEKKRYEDYKRALEREEPNVVKDSFMSGLTSGLSMFIQQWVNALQLWFGGYLLFTFDEYELRDFLIANFAILFSLFGLGAAFQDISDRKEVEKAAGRIFYLLDRKSEIDPLGDEGKKLY